MPKFTMNNTLSSKEFLCKNKSNEKRNNIKQSEQMKK